MITHAFKVHRSVCVFQVGHLDRLQDRRTSRDDARRLYGQGREARAVIVIVQTMEGVTLGDKVQVVSMVCAGRHAK